MSDYISRDVAIIEFMDNDLDHIQAPNGKETVQILSDIPAADVAPVVHAYWRDTGSGQECSACKEIQYGYDTGRYFCANCGAKMDGKREE